MQVLNFGSLNIDHVYTVDHFVAPGEILCSADYRINAGVQAVDTTSAGDTFSGYFLASKLRGMDARTAMEYAALASSIAVSRHGAAVSIPGADEVFQALP